ncbi:leupaxin isoform X2 [Boleophthalmus pectinirostris]|uniref:leupaxin isoform X2 n=1 Tax=Boleophthalmus pectinirostris TaxID=150288 RepID=UPI000A1C1AFA|nr:leupaxin isoform X2 [Boleophthalmus pectinirostris]
MDELDLLLEELALNTSGAGSKEKISTENLAEHTKNVNTSSCSNVYSSPPAPVAATQRAMSPTEELEFILEDLLGLAAQHQEPKESPPPLVPKLSVKRKEETMHRENSNVQPTPSKSTDTIDELLGGLSSDLEKIGVKTTAKGHCAACKKIIVGKIITALGETWHPEHFVCAVCKVDLCTTSFFEREGWPYCAKDYHEQFSPRCAYCKGPILQNILTALDQTWHPEHFFCSHCGDLFGPDGFLEKEGKPYCCKDFYNLFAPKCSGCGEAVRENYLTAANGTWHPECFVCSDCLTPLSSGHFLGLEGQALCLLHYHSRQGSLCGTCGEPITGRCISALSRKFHPEHFVCAFCRRQLSQGIFKDQKGKPYCNTCFNKLFV